MDIILIAAVTLNGKIARNTKDATTWSKDRHLFKKQTIGQTVIFGSTTAKLLKEDLIGRRVIIINRSIIPEETLKTVKTERCFIAGGARTNSLFIDYFTHIYLTVHPRIFSENAVPLFHSLDSEIPIMLEKIIAVDKAENIYQHQYKVVR